jgi:hypothetical protein
VKVLFVARHFTYFRNFESVIRQLAERGHTVRLAAERTESFGGGTLVERLCAEYPGVTAVEAPGREDDDLSRILTKVRLATDYLRFLDPMYDGTPKLRARAAERAPEFARRFGASRWSRRPYARSRLRWLLQQVEAAAPSSPRIERFLRDEQPDALLITPLIGVVESPQPDYVRAARRLAVPAALCVWSWDHLSSKALIRDLPDRVLVWNTVQRDEAIRLHGVPPECVVVTGAQCFDHWFGRSPSRSREAFCRHVGLPADRPMLLYVGSALFRGSPPEAAFVLRWIARIRASGDETLRNAAILVRPHPQRLHEWDGVAPSALAGAAVWGGNPVTDAARSDYFDSLFYSSAVVGLNTSAFLEAAIVGRPVFAILPPEFEDNQEGTVHFHYLTQVGGGLLRVGRTFDEHEGQLAAELRAASAPDINARFVEAFLRPNGVSTPATPVFVEAVEQLAGAVVERAMPAAPRIGRAALSALDRAWRSTRWQPWLIDDEDRRSHAFRQRKVTAADAQRRQRLEELERKQEQRRSREQRRRDDIESWRRKKRQRTTS